MSLSSLRRSASKYQPYVIALGLAILTLAVYWRVLSCGFTNYDDGQYVLQNEHVKSGLSPANLIWAFNVGYASNWHPLTWISHMTDCALFGLRPAGHHAMNLLFHVANTMLLFLVLNRLTKLPWRSAFVAVLFAIHPLHVESVAWIAERKDVLSALLWFVTMWAYVKYAERPSFKRYIPVLLLLGLGLMSKPMLVTLPFALLLLDYWPLSRFRSAEKEPGKKDGAWPGRRLILEKLPLLGLSAVSGTLTFVAQRRHEAVSSLARVPVGMRIEQALVSYASYLLKAIRPSKLAPFYPFPMHAIPVWKPTAAAVALVGISLLVILRRKNSRYLVFGWTWYLVTLLPVIGLVQVGAQAMADRYTYVPLVGVFVMVIWGIAETRALRRRAALVFASLVMIAALSTLTWIQIGYWKNSIVLFTHAMDVTQDNYTAYANLATAYSEQKQYAKAEPYYLEALRYRSDIATLHFDHATCLYGLGKVDQAVQEYETALRLDPHFENARNHLETIRRRGREAARARSLLSSGAGIHDAVYHVNRAVSLVGEGRSAEAVREYQEAIRLSPGFAAAHWNLAVLLRTRGDLDGAIREYNETVRLDPRMTQAHVSLATAYYMKGNYADTWREVHECRKLGLNPSADFLKMLSAKMADPGP